MKKTIQFLFALSTAALCSAAPLDSVQWTVNGASFKWLIRTSKNVSFKKDKPPEESEPVEFHGTFQSAEKATQGLCLGGTKTIQLELNGKEIAPLIDGSEKIFALPIRSGNNDITLTVSDSGQKRTQIHLTPVELDYVIPTAESQLAALRRSIEHLGARHSDYPAKQFLKSLRKLKPDADGIMEKILALQLEALVRNNPVFDFNSLLVRRTKKANFPPNWKGNTGLPKEKYDNEIARLKLDDLELESIYRPENGSAYVGDMCLHPNAQKMLISSINTNENTWQVFELNTDGSGLRQVTPDIGTDVDNYNGIYTPEGKIIFCSTANMTGIPCIGGNDNVGTLYMCDPNGNGMRQLTFEQDADWYPWVMDDGKIMYLRWEYTDNSHYFTRILMTMNPDGTTQRSFYGSNSYWPSTLFYAKNIPGSNRKFTGIVSGHHGINREGELVLFDVSKGEKDTAGAIQKIPGFGKPVENIIRDKYAVGNWPRFVHSVPLSDSYFLASGRLAPNQRFGIYLLDRFDNIVLLKQDDKLNLLEPVPFKARKSPPAIPSHVQPEATDAVLYIQNIYEGPGLAGIPRGTVKKLRLLTYGYGYRKIGGHDALTIEGGWDTKRILGTVPVHPDGSVMVRVPHSTPISIQPLDEDGAALQLMRSWLVAMPGESLSCVGCHESARTSPLQRRTEAMRSSPQPLSPWRDEETHGFGFLREVQPILDRNCVGCHNGSKPDRPNFQSLEPIDKGREYAGSYHGLHPFVRRPGCESDFRLLTPMDHHVSVSELFQLLERGHYGVELSSNDWKTLITWVDLNTPYHPTWTSRYGDERTSPMAERGRELRKRFTGMDDDPEWMPPGETKRPAYQRPTKKRARKKINLPKGLPFKAELEEFQTLENCGGITVRKIPMSGKPFWMAEAEITNEQFRKFKPEHNSRVIDQQWKDHIYPGYPANEPQMPVIRVSWDEAMAYCEWLSEQTGKKVTLPTAEQWEWACRAGSDQPFYFGDASPADYANLADEMIGNLAVRGVDPQPVSARARSPQNDFVPRDASFNDGQLTPSGTKQYKPNGWGLYDMHGNVAEWTRSNYDETRKAVRGGSWHDRPKRATASFELGYLPYQKVFNVGFRILIAERVE